jgi:hypothetical protein
MNESEIRNRVHVAFGEASYPASLGSRVAGRIAAPWPRRQPRVYGLVAAILAVLVIVSLMLTRFAFGLPLGREQTPAIQTNQVVGPMSPNGQLPDADLRTANLSGPAADLVTRLNLTAVSNGRAMTVIGAYADSARTVIFVRSLPPPIAIQVQLYDQTGPLNYDGGGGSGSFGDADFEVAGPVHPDAGGIAHVNASINEAEIGTPLVGTSGNWNFSFPLEVQPSTPLTAIPVLTSFGEAKVRVEALEATPSVVHFQAVVDGLSVEQVSTWRVTLVDLNGNQAQPGSSYTALVGNNKQSRMYFVWARPAAGDYELRIDGSGSHYGGRLAVPAFVSQITRKGKAIQPTGFPSAYASLTMTGAYSQHIAGGHTSQCGRGSGVNTGELFAYAIWFEHDGWYLLALSTDPAQRAYRGPGTYPGHAEVVPYAQFGTDPIFSGPIQLTISSDKGAYTGSVSGTLNWAGPPATGATTTVSGTWSCTPALGLGPG